MEHGVTEELLNLKCPLCGVCGETHHHHLSTRCCRTFRYIKTIQFDQKQQKKMEGWETGSTSVDFEINVTAGRLKQEQRRSDWQLFEKDYRISVHFLNCMWLRRLESEIHHTASICIVFLPVFTSSWPESQFCTPALGDTISTFNVK